jgi:hypothetical protein
MDDDDDIDIEEEKRELPLTLLALAVMLGCMFYWREILSFIFNVISFLFQLFRLITFG